MGAVFSSKCPEPPPCTEDKVVGESTDSVEIFSKLMNAPPTRYESKIGKEVLAKCQEAECTFKLGRILAERWEAEWTFKLGRGITNTKF